MWEDRANRFPEHTPNTREYYLLRSIFEEQFPSQQALATVPKVQRLFCCSCTFRCFHCQPNAHAEMPCDFACHPVMPPGEIQNPACCARCVVCLAPSLCSYTAGFRMLKCDQEMKRR